MQLTIRTSEAHKAFKRNVTQVQVFFTDGTTTKVASGHLGDGRYLYACDVIAAIENATGKKTDYTIG